MWKVLLVLHALSGIVLVGAATHQMVAAVRLLFGWRGLRLARIHACIVAVAYGCTFVFGSVAYPRFRQLVRAEDLDELARWASRLFEAKEDLAALALPLVVSCLALARALDEKSDRAIVVGYAFASGSVMLVAWFDVVAGLLVTMTRAG